MSGERFIHDTQCRKNIFIKELPVCQEYFEDSDSKTYAGMAGFWACGKLLDRFGRTSVRLLNVFLMFAMPQPSVYENYRIEAVYQTCKRRRLPIGQRSS